MMPDRIPEDVDPNAPVEAEPVGDAPWRHYANLIGRLQAIESLRHEGIPREPNDPVCELLERLVTQLGGCVAAMPPPDLSSPPPTWPR